MKMLFSFLIIVLAKCTIAQVGYNIILKPNPPSSLVLWHSQTSILNVLLQSSSGNVVPIKVKTTIKTLDGTIVATSDNSRTSIINVAGTFKLSATDALPLEFMVFNGSYANTYYKTGKLPANNYQFCIALLKPGSVNPIAEEKCVNFFVAAPMLPNLLLPQNESVLKANIAQSAITFRWTPLTPKPTELVTYKLNVFEVLANQTPMQALRSNQPLLDKSVVGTTQYIWQPQMAMFDNFAAIINKEKPTKKDTVRSTTVPGIRFESDNRTLANSNQHTDTTSKASVKNTVVYTRKTFVWTIQTIDPATNLPITDAGNSEARSEPFIFYVDTDPNH